MFFAITLILLGLLAIPSLVLAKKPNAKEYFDKIAPYQGWIGLVFAICGVVGIVFSLIGIGGLFTYPVYWITSLLVSIVEAGLGFILGYSLINKYILSKKPEAAAKGEQVLAKLLPLQGKLGILAIILGVWYFVYYFLLRAIF